MTTKTMRRAEQDRVRLEDVQMPVRLKLSALWATAMFLYVYVDIFGFYKPGTIEDILVGRVWEFDISQAWALGALGLMTIPSLMVALSLALPARMPAGPTSRSRPCSLSSRSETRWARRGPSTGSARLWKRYCSC